MKRLWGAMIAWFDGLAGRTTLVVMLSLAMVFAVNLQEYLSALNAEAESASEARLADRLVTIKRAVMLAPVAERDLVAHSLSGGPISAHWSPFDHAVPGGAQVAALERLADRLKGRVPELADGGLIIGTGRDGMMDDPHLAVISMQFPDRSWLNVALLSLTPVTAVPSPRTLWTISLMSLAGLALAVFLVRWLSRPLAAFALAAKTFSAGAAVSPVAERGPREVRELALAFNEMQARIARLLTDRTQALAAVSHDLRTPITRLRFRAEDIADPAISAAIIRDLDEMERMIEQTLTFLRGKQADEEVRPVDLVAILETIANDMADHGLAVDLQAPARLVIPGRRIALKRALSNLVENAVKYGGQARIRLGETRAGVVVEIEDDGPGIAPADRDRALEPFVRLESSRNGETGGFGLGLTIAASVIEGHGGRLVLTDGAGGRGLLVRVELPAAV